MRRLPLTATVVLLLVLAVLAPPRPAAADQNDSRLDELFIRLLEAPAPGEAQRIEGEIWQIWLESDDGAVSGLMRDGLAAMQRGDYPHALAKFDQMVVIAPAFGEGCSRKGVW